MGLDYDYDDEDSCVRVMVLYKVASAMGILCLFSTVGSRKLINVFPRLSICQNIAMSEKLTQMIKQKAPKVAKSLSFFV